MRSVCVKRVCVKRVCVKRVTNNCFYFAKQFSSFTSSLNQLPKQSLNESQADSNEKPSWVAFRPAKYGNFQQDKPVIENQFTGDAFLQRYLSRVMPRDVLHEITPDLVQFGHRVATDIHDWGRECDIHVPRLVQQDAWGKTVNNLWTSEAWRKQHDISAEEGLVAIAYERKYHEMSRVYQMAKGYLYGPSAGLYGCPLSMTDGAAASIEALGLLKHPLYAEAYQHLISRDASQFWTSGQWMTEKAGGSDVAGGTETVAIHQGGEEYKLYGYKWFSSATDSNIALTLARIADQDGNVVSGTKGLTLFYLKVKDDQGKLNNINMVRLKDKLGTRQLPTAELLLDGTIAHRMSEPGRGVSGISNMLQVTRIHNAVGSSAYMRRILSVARDYSHRRIAFGKPIAKYPLHIQTLARMDLELRGSLMLTFEAVRLFGRKECHIATDEEKLVFRLLNPLAKLHVAKQSMSVISEGLESIGGQALMEDSALPCMLRDAQIFVVWEGTTNILSLDVLRSIAKSGGETLLAFRSHVKKRLQAGMNSNHAHLKDCATRVDALLDQLCQTVTNVNESLLQTAARDFSYSLARIFIASTLIEAATDTKLASNDLDLVTALRWCQSYDLAPFLTNYKLNAYNESAIQHDFKLVMENYNQNAN